MQLNLRQSVLLDHFKTALNTEDEVDGMVREEGGCIKHDLRL